MLDYHIYFCKTFTSIFNGLVFEYVKKRLRRKAGTCAVAPYLLQFIRRAQFL